MEPIKQEIINYAKGLGFGDVRFAPPDPFLEWAEEVAALKGKYRPHAVDRMTHDPRTILPGTSCIIVLLLPYMLAPALPKDTVPFAAYYTYSQRAHLMTLQLAEFIRSRGFSAVPDPNLPAKHAALRAAGGIYGYNTLYIHPGFGSLCCIRLILTDAAKADPKAAAFSPCEKCGRCEKACPTGAITPKGFAAEWCLRTYMGKGEIPKRLRPGVETILGCEICAAVCPHNARIPCVMPDSGMLEAFSYKNVLTGASRAKLEELVGANMLKHGALVSCAAVLAANNGRTDCLPYLEDLKKSNIPNISEHAGWAIKRILKSKRERR
ncbi:MAG: 4Fe-4S double cluster binding domain-containing protein [Bacillota bacterium]|nr:4Fe-4S double cluster binding domain-containing protein [Bacillota bacterium]